LVLGRVAAGVGEGIAGFSVSLTVSATDFLLVGSLLRFR
jgi:hypothetical protein